MGPQGLFLLAMDNKNFFQDVYEIVKLIPAGRVTTYGAIAEYLGAKVSARMVGWAMNASHTEAKIPAHRVVNSVGLLTGKHHFQGPDTMQQRLEAEGVKIEQNRVRNFKVLFWSPKEELL